MASTEWLTELPTKNGVYWYRFDAKSRPDIVQIHDKDVYYTGDGIGLTLAHHTGGQFLGPVSPSDAEQLAELRRVAQSTLEEIRSTLGGMLNHLRPPENDRARDYARFIFEQVDKGLAALNPQPEKETQG